MKLKNSKNQSKVALPAKMTVRGDDGFRWDSGKGTRRGNGSVSRSSTSSGSSCSPFEETVSYQSLPVGPAFSSIRRRLDGSTCQDSIMPRIARRQKLPKLRRAARKRDRPEAPEFAAFVGNCNIVPEHPLHQLARKEIAVGEKEYQRHLALISPLKLSRPGSVPPYEPARVCPHDGFDSARVNVECSQCLHAKRSAVGRSRLERQRELERELSVMKEKARENLLDSMDVFLDGLPTHDTVPMYARELYACRREKLTRGRSKLKEVRNNVLSLRKAPCLSEPELRRSGSPKRGRSVRFVRNLSPIPATVHGSPEAPLTVTEDIMSPRVSFCTGEDPQQSNSESSVMPLSLQSYQGAYMPDIHLYLHPTAALSGAEECVAEEHQAAISRF